VSWLYLKAYGQQHSDRGFLIHVQLQAIYCPISLPLWRLPSWTCVWLSSNITQCFLWKIIIYRCYFNKEPVFRNLFISQYMVDLEGTETLGKRRLNSLQDVFFTGRLIYIALLKLNKIVLHWVAYSGINRNLHPNRNPKCCMVLIFKNHTQRFRLLYAGTLSKHLIKHCNRKRSDKTARNDSHRAW
jgi:hypothetical protein